MGPERVHRHEDRQRRQGGARVVRRRVVTAGGAASDVEFVVGDEISAALVQRAKLAVKGDVKSSIGSLRKDALGEGGAIAGDGTITDDERMFLAGLLEPENAALVAAMSTRAGSTVTFGVWSIRAHMAEVVDFGRATVDPVVTKELAAAQHAWLPLLSPHTRAARDAAIKQIHALTGPGWRRQADAVIAMSGLLAGETLTAMVAAASDSTPGDMVMAGAVYAVAAWANHPLADDIKAGRIKVDQLPGPARHDAIAHYRAFGLGEKGDTIYVHNDLDVTNLAHRLVIIHELEHALDDRETIAGHWRRTRVDEAEVRANRAGAMYALDQLARLDERLRAAQQRSDDKASRTAQHEFDKALAEVAAQHPVDLVALALAARSDLPRFEMLMVSVYGASAASVRQAVDLSLAELLKGPEPPVLALLTEWTRVGSDLNTPAGALDPAKNKGRFDALSGESVLDTVDLPRQR
jgi:hypothetical protein